MDFTNELLTRARQLNIYLIPQYLWLILLYYLTINALYKLYEVIKEKENVLNFDLPNEVLALNNTIMSTIEKWTPFLWFLSIVLIISGFLIASIKFLPIIESYTFSYNGDLGVYFGLWILLIVSTIYLYDFLGIWFPILIPVCCGLTELWKRKIKPYISFG